MRLPRLRRLNQPANMWLGMARFTSNRLRTGGFFVQFNSYLSRTLYTQHLKASLMRLMLVDSAA